VQPHSTFYEKTAGKSNKHRDMIVMGKQ